MTISARTMLFEPIEMRELSLTNRVIVPPMTQYSASEGIAGDWHLMHLGGLSVGGPGMVFTESTYVDAGSRNNPKCLALYTDEQADGLKRVADFIHQHSASKFCVQLCHAGRKAGSRELWRGAEPMTEEEGASERLAPSPIAIKEGWPVPREMSQTDINDAIQAFVDATKRADHLGADAVELHGAHGYLVHQFLSPVSNQRSDRYGGSLQKRMTFALELFEAMRSSLGQEKPLGIRVSATDWVDGMWDVNDTIALAQQLESLGCDFMDVSSGGISPSQKITPGPGYQVALAASIKSAVKMKIIAVGEIANGNQAETILRLGSADMVAVGRRSLSDPRWTWRAAEELKIELQYPKQYERAQPEVRRNKHP